MHRSTLPVTVVLAALLAMPASLASWNSYGTHEPDTVFDTPSWMWPDAPILQTDQIYFNAWLTFEAGATTNPNVGAAQTRINPEPTFWAAAVLGVWADCNGDGYIGIAETAADEYRSEVLDPISKGSPVCPDGTTHNANGWVNEMTWIGTNRQTTVQRNDPRVIIDNDTRMWGDFGVPNAYGPDSAGTGSATCAINPLPKGAMQRTGGALDYIDCFDGWLVARQTNAALILLRENASSTQLNSTTNPLLIPVGDSGPRWESTGYIANHGTLGSDSSSRSMVYATDCTQPSLLKPVATTVNSNEPAAVKAVANSQSDLIAPANGPRPPRATPEIHAPEPSAAPPGDWNGGTVAGTVNETFEETTQDCDATDDSGHDVYRLEGESTPVAPQGKQDSNLWFNFSAEARGQPLGTFVSSGTYDQTKVLGDTPGCLGLSTQFDSTVVCGATYWHGNTNYVDAAFPPALGIATGPIVRNQDTALNHTLSYGDARFVTYYAHVGNAALTGHKLPGGGAGGVYAKTGGFCPTTGTGAGIHHGWNCDGATWHKNSDGTAKDESVYPASRPGDPFELRDVDCYDYGALGLSTPWDPLPLDEGTIDQQNNHGCYTPA